MNNFLYLVVTQKTLALPAFTLLRGVIPIAAKTLGRRRFGGFFAVLFATLLLAGGFLVGRFGLDGFVAMRRPFRFALNTF